MDIVHDPDVSRGLVHISEALAAYLATLPPAERAAIGAHAVGGHTS
jgi:hypothetical protein